MKQVCLLGEFHIKGNEKILYTEKINTSYVKGRKLSIRLLTTLFTTIFICFKCAFVDILKLGPETIIELVIQSCGIILFCVISMYIYNKYIELGYLIITDKRILWEICDLKIHSISFDEIKNISIENSENFSCITFVGNKWKVVLPSYFFNNQKIIHFLEDIKETNHFQIEIH